MLSTSRAVCHHRHVEILPPTNIICTRTGTCNQTLAARAKGCRAPAPFPTAGCPSKPCLDMHLGLLFSATHAPSTLALRHPYYSINSCLCFEDCSTGDDKLSAFFLRYYFLSFSRPLRCERGSSPRRRRCSCAVRGWTLESTSRRRQDLSRCVKQRSTASHAFASSRTPGGESLSYCTNKCWIDSYLTSALTCLGGSEFVSQRAVGRDKWRHERPTFVRPRRG